MRSRQLLAAAAVGMLALSAAACGSSSSSSSSGGSASASGAPSGSINGAGSTLAAPVYEQWGSELSSKGITLNYQAVGSGAGISQWEAGTSSFAGSDPPLKPSDIATASKKGSPVEIPTVLGAITVSYSLPGVKSGLKLDGATIADIFLGKVKTWDDPAIKSQNPGVSLPSTSITVVHRSDSSGTTKGFTQFLAAYSPEWASKVGSDKTVQWPIGTGAKGNSGVAAAVKQTPGSIGYVEQAYALQNNFTFAAVKNKAGSYVAPTLASTTAAADNIAIPSNLAISTINAPGAGTYPIVSQTFVVIYQDMCKAGVSKGEAQRIVAFLKYGLSSGQQVAQQLSYAPLPAKVISADNAKIATLQCNGAALTA